MPRYHQKNRRYGPFDPYVQIVEVRAMSATSGEVTGAMLVQSTPPGDEHVAVTCMPCALSSCPAKRASFLPSTARGASSQPERGKGGEREGGEEGGKERG